MGYTLATYQNIAMGMSADFDLAKFVDDINKTQANAVTIGQASMLKNNIRDVLPQRVEGETPEGQKLLVYTNRRDAAYIAYAKEYDADDVSQQYNDTARTLMLIGDISIHRNEYSMVVPAE